MSNDGNAKSCRHDIFLSHNSNDKPVVRELKRRLCDAGLNVWLDEDDLIAGRPWLDAIEQALLNSSVIIVAVGPSGLGPWETPEMRAALIQMVRHQTTVVPVLLPGAPKQVELPLFLQTLTWVDCRDGITETGIQRITQSVHVAKNAPVSDRKFPLRRSITTAGTSGTSSLADFWKFIADFQSLIGWAVKAGFLAPLIPLLLGFGPPWDGESPWQEKANVCLMTAIIQVLAVTASYFIFPPMPTVRIRKHLFHSLLVCTAAMTAYITMFVLLTEIQPNTNHRLIAGWKYSEDFQIVRAATNDPVASIKMDMGFSPLTIYEPWTVWTSLLLLVFGWLFFFGSIVFYLGLFVKNIPALQKDSLTDDRALVSLGLPREIRHKLHAIEVQTVGDLCALNERQLNHVLENSRDDYLTIAASLQQYGIRLRQ